MGTGTNRGSSSIIEYNLFILKKKKKKYEYIYNVHEISVLK